MIEEGSIEEPSESPEATEAASATPLHSEANRPSVEVGAIPGSLVKHEFAFDSVIRLIEYKKGECNDRFLKSHDELREKLGLAGYSPRSRDDCESVVAASAPAEQHETASSADDHSSQQVSWLNVDGLANIDFIRSLGKQYGLHALALEDVVNVNQRAKTDAYETNLFVVARMPVSAQPFVTEQVSMFILGDRLITLQEREGDCLDPVRNRIDSGKGRIRTRGADYLAYAILDAIVDAYFPILERYDEVLCAIYDELQDGSDDDIPKRLHLIRADLLNIRKVARQHEDAVAELLREGAPIISESTQPFLRDCLDHLRRLTETADTYRESCGELRELYFALLGQKTNDSMKVLSVIATVFIPMSLIAGIYGMNFDSDVSPMNMPELHWAFGYPFAILTMLCTGGGLLLFLRRRGWL